MVAPIFFLLILGIIEFGRMVMVQQIVTNGSREGARIAVLDGATGDEVRNSVSEYLASASVPGATVTITPDPPSTAGYGEPVTVSVSVAFDQVSWLPSPMFLGGKELAGITVMRREAGS